MEYLRFFRRQRIEGLDDGKVYPGLELVKCANLDEYAYAPAIAGSWQQHQVWDGTYTLDDLLDWHEMQRVKSANEQRLKEWHERMGRN